MMTERCVMLLKDMSIFFFYSYVKLHLTISCKIFVNIDENVRDFFVCHSFLTKKIPYKIFFCYDMNG